MICKKLKDEDFKILYDFFNNSYKINEEIFNVVKSFCIKRVYQKGECILKEGEIEQYSNVVIKGVVHQYIVDIDKEVTTNLTPAGLGFNSLVSYVNQVPTEEIQEALTDVELISLKKEHIEEILKNYNEIGILLYRLHEDILLDRENRMHLLQYRSAAKRFKYFYENVERSKLIIQHTPDKHIARYLKMNPQQYSKEKNIFYKSL
ncbi:cyclic nucleotide-binding domain-containing protein [Cellulophaga lytica]|uniref:Crp/Fnr family transcriptional regulator n=1 Tax=Cellulophaga lytica TaxID=979 RepID=UPI0026E12D73|nr:cyclic nucleotide-binding domain-containing protein [Cellulophaga lytica]MDO6853415.1 cyclic nucleotide-binding domain-containing protein [Cellulophaga lytica]